MKHNFSFDPRGYLSPDLGILFDIETFESEFVVGIVDEVRRQLFENFLAYSKSLMEDLGLQELDFWLNGSFATKKKNPIDLDVVVFIDYKVVESTKPLLQMKYHHTILLENWNLDAYIVIVFPENHANYRLVALDTAYWMHQFTRTRPNRQGKTYKKGFVKLKITNDEVKAV